MIIKFSETTQNSYFFPQNMITVEWEESKY